MLSLDQMGMRYCLPNFADVYHYTKILSNSGMNKIREIRLVIYVMKCSISHVIPSILF